MKMYSYYGSGELWSSPLMNYKSPFDDFEDLYEEIEDDFIDDDEEYPPVFCKLLLLIIVILFLLYRLY